MTPLSNRKSEIERSLNEDLNTINNWCIQNNMLINPTKTLVGVRNGASRIILAARFCNFVIL
jgi:hypothetical protein